MHGFVNRSRFTFEIASEARRKTSPEPRFRVKTGCRSVHSDVDRWRAIFRQSLTKHPRFRSVGLLVRYPLLADGGQTLLLDE